MNDATPREPTSLPALRIAKHGGVATPADREPDYAPSGSAAGSEPAGRSPEDAILDILYSVRSRLLAKKSRNGLSEIDASHLEEVKREIATREMREESSGRDLFWAELEALARRARAVTGR